MSRLSSLLVQAQPERAPASDTALLVVRDTIRLVDLSTWPPRVDWEKVAASGLQILVILALAWVAFRVLVVLLRRVERSIGPGTTGTVSLQEQRAATLLGLLRSVGIVFIVVIALFMVLSAVGVNIGPLLAGAGVLGLAISFGAQSLVKDIISGLFILFEDQFHVGDVIRIGTVSGRVERMTLRIVVMRDAHGVMHIVPNGEIKQVSNMTRSFSRAVLDLNVALEEDADRVIEVMRAVGEELWSEPEWRALLLNPVEVPGIEAFTDGAITIRMLATTLPMRQWDVGRELRRRLKRRFHQEGIELPSRHYVLQWGPGHDPREPATGNREQPADAQH